MKTSGNSILITGGATGIGLSIAEYFINNGNEVLICGRRENKLQEARQKLPRLQTKVCNVSVEKERESLYNWVNENFNSVNILVNNAGIQRTVDFKNGVKDFPDGKTEIEVNLVAPVHLSALFIPLLMKQKVAAIINISSSLAFMTMPHIPIYCVTKAGMHTFSVALRQQLNDTSIKVFEIVPPMVDTELYKGRKEKGNIPFKGIQPSQLIKPVSEAIENNEYEIVIGEAIRSVSKGKEYLEQILQHHKPVEKLIN